MSRGLGPEVFSVSRLAHPDAAFIVLPSPNHSHVIFSDIFLFITARHYRTGVRVEPPVLNLSWVGQL
jgi:hypothetical protein